MAEKLLYNDVENLEVPEDVRNEVLLLYNLGVGIDDLKYFLTMKINRVI